MRTSAAVRAQGLVTATGTAARQARRLKTGKFDPAYAAQLAADLAEALPHLQALEERLRLRGRRRPRPGTPPAGPCGGSAPGGGPQSRSPSPVRPRILSPRRRERST